jgi:predicted benzoate:H+ symporter BenE
MSEPGKGDPVGKFFAGAVIAVGALIFGLCGLCTAGFLVASAVSPGGAGLASMALIGAIPTGIGFLVLRFGLAMYREESNRERPADPEAPDA